MEMVAADLANISILSECVELAAESAMANSSAEEEELLEEVSLLQSVSAACISPVHAYYLQAETEMCDVPPAFENYRHDYGPNRKRTIASLTDFEALTFLNFSRAQLFRVYECFGWGDQVVRVTCHETCDYMFTAEEMFVFGVCKLCTGFDNTQLCHHFFGGSPRRWSSEYKWFCLTWWTNIIHLC